MNSTARRGLTELEAIEADRVPIGVLSDVSDVLERVVGYDGSYLSITDPMTILPSTASIIGLPATTCAPYWDGEYLIDDFGKFVDLHRSAPVP